MENKLPFYMAYPVPLLYNDDGMREETMTI